METETILVLGGTVVALVVLIVAYLVNRNIGKLNESLSVILEDKERKDTLEESYLKSTPEIKSVVDIFAKLPSVLISIVPLIPEDDQENRAEVLALLKKIDKFLEEVTDGKPNV